MKIEEQQKANDLSRKAVLKLEEVIDLLGEASGIAIRQRAFTQAANYLRKAAACDGLRAEVFVGIIEDRRPLPGPVVATGHEQKEIKA